MCDTTGNICEDRISSLPESLMSHILSRLPTKEAVQTCVLSTAWKYNWTSIHNVDMADSEERVVTKENEAVFFDFMQKMSLHSLSHNVQSFSLKCYGCYDFIHMSEWISAVLGPKLHTFKLFYNWEGLVLPKALVHCTSLKTLKLNSRFTFKVPSVHTFPNLIDLHLLSVDILNEDSVTSTMILKFPVLKVLRIIRCKWLNVKTVELHAPALIELSSETDFRAGESNYSIQIMGARLSKFTTRFGLHDNLVFSGSKVDFAALNCVTGYEKDSKLYQEFALQVRRLLNELWSMKHLTVSSHTTEAIAQPNPNPNPCLPTYDKLERLDIQYDVTRHNSLWELLNAAPNLKILHVEMCNIVNYNLGHGHGLERPVPSCIASTLEEFKITIGRRVSKAELLLIMFLIENGQKLKKIYILFGSNGQNARAFLDRVLKFTKASTRLQVVGEYKKSLDLRKLLADE